MRYILLLVFLFSIVFGFAQGVFPVQLKSGDYYPQSLDSAISKEDIKKERYVILQFGILPDMQAFYLQTGIKLHDYLPQNSYYAVLPDNFDFSKPLPDVTGIMAIYPQMKTDPLAWIDRKVDRIKLVYFEEAGLENLELTLKDKGFEVLYHIKNFHTIYIGANTNISEVVAIPGIYWAEPVHGQLSIFNLVERSNHRAAAVGDNSNTGKGLTGKGIAIGEWDGGDVGKHEDYNTRLTLVKKAGVSDHATHVCGTMAGAGNIDPTAKGMAPQSKIYSWDFNDNITAEMDTNYLKFGYTLTQNSYAYSPGDDPCSLRGNYDQTSVEMDAMVEKYPNLLHVFAAGNSRGDNCKASGFNTISSGFQSAKNVMSVAAITNFDEEAGFSSCGPTRDGRLKPEVSAVGVNVYSTLPNNSYGGGWSGTSMACPGASGTTALIYEYFQRKKFVLPEAHLAKSLMANSADDIGNTGPDFRHGFGRINAKRAIQIIDSSWFLQDSLKHNKTISDTINIPKGLFRLKVMLCWNDKAGAAGAKPSLINDLDITITDSAGTKYKPWVLDTLKPNNIALRGRDSLNNLEQITIDFPKSGRMIVTVFGKRITSSFQKYSLTWDLIKTEIQMVYPNGLETFPPPSSNSKSQTIRWDANNLNGNAKLEYSLDQGASWVLMISTVAVNQKYFIWNNAQDTINTSKALVRISSGAFADMSDTAFNICKSPGTLLSTLCDSQVHFKWLPQKNAVGYKLFQLINGGMQVIYKGTDTFFTVKKLNTGKDYWFALSSISNRGAESVRTYAIKITPNSTIKPVKIILNLIDTAGCKNTTMVLKSSATGTGPIQSVWQISFNNGSVWNVLSGRQNDTLILKNIKFSQVARKYRRVYFNVCQETVYTYPAKVEVDTLTPSFVIPPDTIGCTGGDMTLRLRNLNSVSKPSIHWMAVCSNGGSTGTLKKSKESFLELKNLSSVDAINYPVKATNACGTYCVKAGCCGTKLNVVPKLALNLKDRDTICLGQSYLIQPAISDGNPNLYQFKWKGPDTMAYSRNLRIKPDTSSPYFFEVNDQNCTPGLLHDSIQIIVRDSLKLFVRQDTTICYGTSVLLNASAKGGNGNYTFLWNQGLSIDSSHSVSPLITTTYFITLSDSCSTMVLTDSILVKVLPPLLVSLKSQSDSICFGQNTNLTTTISGGLGKNYDIEWNTKETTSSIAVSPLSSKYFSVKVTDHCSNPSYWDSIKVNVWQVPKVQAAEDTTLCYGQEHAITLIPSGGRLGTVKTWWEFNKAIFGQSTLNLNIKQEGVFNYIAVIKDACGFSDRDTTAINVLGKLDINPKVIQKCSSQDSLILFSTNGGIPSATELRWLDGNKGFSRLFNEKITTIYPVIISDGCSDTSMSNITVVVDEFGSNDFEFQMVFNKSVTIHATLPLQKVEWTFGDGMFNSSNDTLIEIAYKNYGTYQVCRKQIDHIGCIKLNCKDVDVINVLTNANFMMNLYPNPNKGSFELSFNKIPGQLNVEVFNQLGQILFSQSSRNYIGTLFPIELGDVSPGVYILKVNANDEVITKKIFVR